VRTRGIRARANDIADILGTCARGSPRASRERVRFDLAADLPTVYVDFAQMAAA